MKTINRLHIETAQNGFIVTESASGSKEMMYSYQPYVFETFEALASWLKENLAIPPATPTSS